MKVLILGSNGLLGQKLVQLFYKNKIEFMATSKSENKISSITDFNFQQLDFTIEKDVKKIILNFMPTLIINAGGMTNVDACARNKNESWKTNVESKKFIVDAANSINAFYLHTSTDFVFDGENGPYSENDKPNPVNYYGQTKLEAEKYVIENCNSWSIVRTVLVYGITDNMNRSNIVLWVKKSLENKKPIKVVDDQYRTPTLAEDLALACYLVANERKQGIYHISGSEMMSIYEIALKVAEFYNLDKELITPVSSETLNEKNKRPPKTGFIIDKAKKELGYKPHSFINGLTFLKNQVE